MNIPLTDKSNSHPTYIIILILLAENNVFSQGKTEVHPVKLEMTGRKLFTLQCNSVACNVCFPLEPGFDSGSVQMQMLHNVTVLPVTAM